VPNAVRASLEAYIFAEATNDLVQGSSGQPGALCAAIEVRE
jgi:hypothetical protein